MKKCNISTCATREQHRTAFDLNVNAGKTVFIFSVSQLRAPRDDSGPCKTCKTKIFPAQSREMKRSV